MKKENVIKICQEVLPKIEKFYGMSKHHKSTPWLDVENSIYAKLMGEEVDDEDGEESPDAEYDHDENVISIFYPKMRSKQHVIMSLIHEYTHYLQSPSWYKRYYTMGYNYLNHPYELAALEAEKDWKLFC
tara:strand:- start:10440 stop:10829 length:390 start_codon:yes stop_codon:yes gene_type:complete